SRSSWRSMRPSRLSTACQLVVSRSTTSVRSSSRSVLARRSSRFSSSTSCASPCRRASTAASRSATPPTGTSAARSMSAIVITQAAVGLDSTVGATSKAPRPGDAGDPPTCEVPQLPRARGRASPPSARFGPRERAPSSTSSRPHGAPLASSSRRGGPAHRGVSSLMELALEDCELFDEHAFAKFDPPDMREQLRSLVLVPPLLGHGARKLVSRTLELNPLLIVLPGQHPDLPLEIRYLALARR